MTFLWGVYSSFSWRTSDATQVLQMKALSGTVSAECAGCAIPLFQAPPWSRLANGPGQVRQTPIPPPLAFAARMSPRQSLWARINQSRDTASPPQDADCL